MPKSATQKKRRHERASRDWTFILPTEDNPLGADPHIRWVPVKGLSFAIYQMEFDMATNGYCYTGFLKFSYPKCLHSVQKALPTAIFVPKDRSMSAQVSVEAVLEPKYCIRGPYQVGNNVRIRHTYRYYQASFQEDTVADIQARKDAYCESLQKDFPEKYLYKDGNMYYLQKLDL